MAWDVEMVEILRVMINDMVVPYKFSDERLKKVILASAQIVNTDAAGTFNQNYIADIVNISITPDPTDRDAGTRDDNYVTLTLIKSACFVDSSIARDAARKGGISIREWNTSIDTKGMFQSAFALLESKGGWCNQYAEGIFVHLTDSSSGIGVGVFGPFRLIYNAYNSSGGHMFSNNQLFSDHRR